MKNRELAEKIYKDLNKRGAGIGNASIGIIKKTLDEQLHSNVIGWIKDDFENQQEVFIRNPNYKGYKITESPQGLDVNVYDGKEWRYLFSQSNIDKCKNFIDRFLKTDEIK